MPARVSTNIREKLGTLHVEERGVEFGGSMFSVEVAFCTGRLCSYLLCCTVASYYSCHRVDLLLRYVYSRFGEKKFKNVMHVFDIQDVLLIKMALFSIVFRRCNQILHHKLIMQENSIYEIYCFLYRQSWL